MAERTILCVSSDRTRREVTIRIGRPRQEADGTWVCEVALEGLYRDRASAKGVDSFQALSLAMGLVRNTLEEFIRGGGRMFWSDASGELDLHTLFS